MTNSFSDTVREALAKKQAASQPQDKKSRTKAKGKNKPNYGVPVITGNVMRKASGRGG